MSAQGLTIYCKNAHAVQYVHYDSFNAWNYKVSWIRGLVTRAKCICTILDKIFKDFFIFLAQFVFTASELELNYYHQKVHVRVASRVAERLKTRDLTKLGNFKKISEMLGFDGEYPAIHPKAKI